MTLLTIAQSLAVNVSVAKPSVVMSAPATDADAAKIIQFTQEAADEVTRRVDWGATRKTVTINGNGTNSDFNLPVDFSRLIAGTAIKSAFSTVRVGISADELNSLTPIEGTPRYARLASGKITFYPYPSLTQDVRVTYQSTSWCANGRSWASDSDVALIPEELIRLGALWRWRRNLGADYQDNLAEFEAALADLSKFDDGIRSP